MLDNIKEQKNTLLVFLDNKKILLEIKISSNIWFIRNYITQNYLQSHSIIHSLLGMDTVNASLPIPSAIILIILSLILTIIGGFIPSKKAAKKDPVTALRTE